MRKFKEYTSIHPASKEIFLPLYLLNKPIFKNYAIKLGGYSILTRGTKIQRESNRKYHIILMTIEGEGKFIMENGEEFILRKGECFFSSAFGQGHQHLPITDEWKICWLQINQDTNMFLSIPEDYRIINVRKTQEINHCFSEIITEHLEEGPNHAIFEELQYNLLLQYIQREVGFAANSVKNMHYLKKFSELWKEVSINITEPWDVDMCADFLGLSKTHLVRLCNEFYHTSPAKKVKEQKMHYAYTLLAKYDSRVSDVAEAIGFNSISSFTYAFKNFFGFLPKEAMLYDKEQIESQI